jgi:hypothetical protein
LAEVEICSAAERHDDIAGFKGDECRKRTSTGGHDRLAQQKVTKSSRAVMKQREQAEIVKEGTTPAF